MDKKLWLLPLLGAAVLAALFVLLKPPIPPEPAAAAPVLITVAALQVQVIDVAVQNGQRVSGPDLIQAVQGQEITLRITSDKADELHLHGYDLSLKLQPGVPAELSFKASLSGRFEYELHHAHAALGVLEVQPK